MMMDETVCARKREFIIDELLLCNEAWVVYVINYKH